jgi:ATP-dependent Clp protease ATP-binding subunit ClpA
VGKTASPKLRNFATHLSLHPLAYSDNLKRSLHIAQAVAHEYRQEHYAAPHLLTALLHNEIGLASWLVAVLDKDIHYLREWAEVRLEDQPKAARPPEMPTPDPGVNVVDARQVNNPAPAA